MNTGTPDGLHPGRAPVSGGGDEGAAGRKVAACEGGELRTGTVQLHAALGPLESARVEWKQLNDAWGVRVGPGDGEAAHELEANREE